MLITERNYIEAIPEMSDSELMSACAEAEPGDWQDAAIKELLDERGYSREDVQDEADRVLYWRARNRMTTDHFGRLTEGNPYA
jgi:hypothetical protein